MQHACACVFYARDRSSARKSASRANAVPFSLYPAVLIDTEQKERLRRQRAQSKARMIAEEEKKIAAEAAIAAMEAEEARLIERLRKTQEDQSAAYEDLKTSLAQK